MDDLYINYYNNPKFYEDQPISLSEEERIKETIKLIPEDCSSILDVGCGDGRLINRLLEENGKTRFLRICGLDISENALMRVRTEKYLGSIESLPFMEREFDIVLCCEVLEHLPWITFPKAVEELTRVAKNYLIISVPRNENLKNGLVTCPHCFCSFNPCRHVRSFTLESLEKYFIEFGFILKSYKLCYNQEKIYPAIVYKIARYFGIIGLPSERALCPQCGYIPIRQGSQNNLIINTNKLKFKDKLRSIGKRIIPGRKGAVIIAFFSRQ